MIFTIDLNNNLNAAVIFLLEVLMTHCLLAVINLVPIGNLCIFDIQYIVGRTFVFSE